MLDNLPILDVICEYIPLFPFISRNFNFENIIIKSAISKFILISYSNQNLLYQKNIYDYPLHNFEFIINLIKQNYIMIKYLPLEFKSNFNIAKIAININGNSIRYFNDNIKDNKVLAINAMKNGAPLYYLSKRLRSNINFVKYAIEIDKQSIRYMEGEWFQNDYEFAREMVMKKDLVISQNMIRISNIVKSDYDLASMCIEVLGYQAFRCLKHDLKSNIELIKFCRKMHLEKSGFPVLV